MPTILSILGTRIKDPEARYSLKLTSEAENSHGAVRPLVSVSNQSKWVRESPI